MQLEFLSGASGCPAHSRNGYHGNGASYLVDDLAPLRKSLRALYFDFSTYCRLTYCVGQLGHVFEALAFYVATGFGW